MAEPGISRPEAPPVRPDASPAGQPGWREVLLVAVAATAVVLGAQILTEILPPDVARVVYETPLLIGVLVLGTAILLLRILIRRSDP